MNEEIFYANPRLGVFGVCYGDTFKMSDIFNRDALRPKKGFDETVMFIGLEKGSYGQRPSSYVAWFKMQPKDESLVRTDGSILGRGMLVSSVIKNRMIERVIPGPFHGHIVQIDDNEIDS